MFIEVCVCHSAHFNDTIQLHYLGAFEPIMRHNFHSQIDTIKYQ